MKKIYFAFIALSLLLFIQSCNKDLPYPIDEVKKGVVIDITRVTGSDPVLWTGSTSGNYKVKLTIPTQQGDYSFMKNAQLLAVLKGADGKYKSKVVVDNITDFPKEITINVADVYSKLGLTAPSLGEVLYFTTNVVLNDGDVIPGWTEYIGFNNKAFASWNIDNRAYSYNVSYQVACPLVLDDFVGTAKVTLDEWWGETPYNVTIAKTSATELKVTGLCNGACSNDLIIKVNTTDFTVKIDKQILEPQSGYWWSASGKPTYNNFSLAGAGTINACEHSISFTAEATVDAGSFGNNSFTIKK